MVYAYSLRDINPDSEQAVLDGLTEILTNAWSASSGGKVSKETKAKLSNEVTAWTNSLVTFLSAARAWRPDAIRQLSPDAQLALKKFVKQAKQLGKYSKGVSGLTPDEQKSINNLSSDGNEFVYSRIYEQLLSAAGS